MQHLPGPCTLTPLIPWYSEVDWRNCRVKAGSTSHMGNNQNLFQSGTLFSPQCILHFAPKCGTNRAGGAPMQLCPTSSASARLSSRIYVWQGFLAASLPMSVLLRMLKTGRDYSAARILHCVSRVVFGCFMCYGNPAMKITPVQEIAHIQPWKSHLHTYERWHICIFMLGNWLAAASQTMHNTYMYCN